MKKNIIFALTCMISISLQTISRPEASKPTSRTTTVTAAELEFTKLHTLCLQQYTLLYNRLLQGLSYIDTNLQHWKQERSHPWQANLTQSPRYWLSSLSYSDRITRNVFRLKQKHKLLTYHLGKLNELINEAKDITDIKLLKQHISTYYAFVPAAIGATIPEKAPTTYTHMVRHMLTSIELIKNYSRKLTFELRDISSGGHIERNWLKYTIATAAALGAGYYTSNNYNEMHEAATDYITATREGISNFWKTHIQEAFTNARDAIFKPRIDLETRKKDIESGIRQLKNILERYRPELTSEDVENITQDYRRSLVIPPCLAEDINQIEENPGSNLANPLNWNKAKNLTAFWMHTKKIKMEDMEQQIDILLKLALISPALVIAKTAWNGATKVAGLFKHKQLYTPVKKYLLKMERKLNAQTNKSEKPDYYDQGLMIYWGHELRKLLRLIPQQERDDFVKDIKEIERADFTAQQKIATIKRMYRTYEFLLPDVH